MVNFISAPLKTTNEVDLIKPLKTFIDSTEFSNDLKAESNEGIIELNKLRNRACVQPLDKHQSSLDLLMRYYDQLYVMENKLPITPTQNPVSFKWRDAFDKGSLFFSRASLTINDSAFERASVLFNMAALMSAIAATQQIHTDEELKMIAKLFQQSAGIFSKLKDTVLGLVQQEPTPDLMPDTLTALSILMLSQAQEAIYMKAHKDQMKPSALVKISAQCADFYQDAQKLMTRDAVKGIWEKEWLSIVNGKNLAFSALAQFHGAQVAGEEKKIGEQLCRLREAQKLMDQSNSYFSTAANFPTESAAIKKALEQATKDNDFIYHERIPDFKSLPLLPKASLAKPIPVNVPMSPRFKDLFESLVPVSIQNAIATFEARKADNVNMDVGRMREYTQLMNACLASMNLPAALDDVVKHEKCPESIRQKSAKVKSSGGIEAIRSKINELPILFKRNEEILNETSRLLKEEKENDDNLRIQFGTRWTRLSSESLTAPLSQELGKYRGILNTATNADAIVKSKFEENRRGIEMLSMTENELKNAIPGLSEQSSVSEQSSAVSKLRELMNTVQEIKVERENVEKELKKIRCDMSNEFMKSLSANGVVNEEKISMEKIQQLFKPLKDQVEQSIKRQESVMAEVEIWNKRFAEERHSAGNAERENLLKQLAKAHDVFTELESNLNEGTKFYNDLTPILVRLQQKVSDFCFARQTEKEDLMKQLQQNIVSGDTGGAATAVKLPPPRPPPPTSSTAPTLSSAPPPASNLMNSNPYNYAPAPQMPNVPFLQGQQHYQQNQQHYQQGQQQPAQPYYQQQPNPYVPYSQPPAYPQQQYGAPQPGQQQQNYGTPYPIQYPGTYPGAYPHQQYGAYPPQPQFGGAPQAPQQPQQNTNPFQ